MAFQLGISPTLLPYGAENSPPALQRAVLDLLATYMDAWEDGDYQLIRSLSPRFYGMATDIRQRVELITYFSVRNRKLSDKEDASLTKVLRELAADNSPAAQQLRDAMRAQLEQDLDAADVQPALDALLAGEHPVIDKALTESTDSDDHADLLSDQYVSMISFGTAADYLGYLRTGLAAPLAPIPPRTGDIALTEELGTRLETIVTDNYRDLYTALKEEHTAGEVSDLAITRQGELQGLFGICGALLGAFLPLIPREADPATRRKAYRAALGLTEHCNRALVQIAYLAYLRINLSLRSYKRWFGNERRRTDNRSLTTDVDQGSPTPIGEIISPAGPGAGTLVQTEGLVTALDIRDDQSPPKFSTFVTLTDVVTNESVQLRAHMFGLEDNGVSVGSYLRVNGFVRKQEHWLAADEVGLDIDRVNQGELARQHWIDDVVERMKEHYPLYKDGMNMFYTLN